MTGRRDVIREARVRDRLNLIDRIARVERDLRALQDRRDRYARSLENIERDIEMDAP
jgi:hypothetical protein